MIDKVKTVHSMIMIIIIELLRHEWKQKSENSTIGEKSLAFFYPFFVVAVIRIASNMHFIIIIPTKYIQCIFEHTEFNFHHSEMQFWAVGVCCFFWPLLQYLCYVNNNKLLYCSIFLTSNLIDSVGLFRYLLVFFLYCIFRFFPRSQSPNATHILNGNVFRTIIICFNEMYFRLCCPMIDYMLSLSPTKQSDTALVI